MTRWLVGIATCALTLVVFGAPFITAAWYSRHRRRSGGSDG